MFRLQETLKYFIRFLMRKKVFKNFIIDLEVWWWQSHFEVHNSLHLQNEIAFGCPTSIPNTSNIRNTTARIDSSNMPFAMLIVTSVPWLRPDGSRFLIWIYVITSQARHEQKGFSIARKFHIIVFAVFENYLHKFLIRFVFSSSSTLNFFSFFSPSFYENKNWKFS